MTTIAPSVREEWADINDEDINEEFITDLGDERYELFYELDEHGQTQKISKKYKKIRDQIRVKTCVKNRASFKHSMETSMGETKDLPQAQETNECVVEVPRAGTTTDNGDWFLGEEPSILLHDLRNEFSILESEEDDKSAYNLEKLDELSAPIAGSVPPTTDQTYMSMMSSSNVGSTSAPVSAGTYHPPSSSTFQGGNQEEWTVRVSNLSEDANEDDLRELFNHAGTVFKVRYPRNPNPRAPKDYAFVTYKTQEGAIRAIKTFDGHGYDHLIMKVEWPKWKTPFNPMPKQAWRPYKDSR